MSVQLTINKCGECPHKHSKRQYTADSWEHASEWLCRAADDKQIAGYIEWSRDEPKKIPEWCPLRKAKP